MAKKIEVDKIALDNAAALAAGMSYGKWKAMQEVKIKPKEIPEGWLVCQHCGKAFKPKTKRPTKYCEVFCQERASQAREKARRAAL